MINYEMFRNGKLSNGDWNLEIGNVQGEGRTSLGNTI